MRAQKVAQVYATYDYDSFKELEGNRETAIGRVGKIIESIKQNGQIMIPIIVNESKEVIDGQGRLAACKRLGLPVYYIEIKGIGIKECMAINAYQTNWKQNDYIDSNAKLGSTDFQYLKILKQNYPMHSLQTILYSINDKLGGQSADIKHGTLQCTAEQYMRACRSLDAIKQFVPLFTQNNKNTQWMQALIFCERSGVVDMGRLYTKLTILNNNVAVANTAQAVERLEEVYNYKNRNKVYLTELWKREQDIRRSTAQKNAKKKK